MDLKKLRRRRYYFEFTITDHDLHLLGNIGLIPTPFPHFLETKTFIHTSYSANAKKMYVHAESKNKEKYRYFYHFQIRVIGEKIYENSFWSCGDIYMMTLEDLQNLPNPRKIMVILRVGVYEGSGTPDEWKNILSCIDDFTPVVVAPTVHSRSMDELLQMNRFSDITIVCKDRKELNAHKCMMMGCPYFRELLSESITKPMKDTVEVEFEYDLLKIVLQFLYSGRIDMENVTNWADLYSVARRFGLDILARHCQLQLMLLTTNNIFEIKSLLKFAVKCEARKLTVYLINVARKVQLESCKTV